MTSDDPSRQTFFSGSAPVVTDAELRRAYGTPPGGVCRGCGGALPVEARYCMYCGLAVADSLVEAHRTPTELARGGDTAEERKLVTVLFADLVGFTHLAERLDPEEVRELQSVYFERMRTEVARFGGTIDKYAGDAVLAFFGVPVAHEDDPERAVECALAMQAAIAALTTEAARRWGSELALRVGVNTGEVVAGIWEVEGRQDYAVSGDAVNLAARLQTAARPTTVLIAPETYRRVAGSFECVDRGAIRVKGKARPIHAYEVRGHWFQREGAPRGPLAARGLAHAIRSRLVGRAAEIDALRASLVRLAAGQGGLVAITGGPGLGKTRLVSELRQQPFGRDLLWLEGQTLSFGQTISYWPFREMLRSYAGIGEDDSDASAWDKLQDALEHLFADEAADVLPYVATALGLQMRGAPAERVRYLDSDAMRRQVFRAMRRLVERLAREQPVVLVFEDVHWMDQSSTELVAHLLPLVEVVPLAIWALSRPEPDTPAARLQEIAVRQYAGRYTEVALAPLTATESGLLVDNLVPAEDSSVSLREFIFRRAEGNPFFTEEVVRSLIDQRAVNWDERTGRWRAPRLDDVSIPDTIQGVIAARLDRLDESVRDVLRVAAVIGRSFPYRVLRAVVGDGTRLEQRLTELQQLELIREQRWDPEPAYSFTHALTQEVVYARMLVRQRRELHRRVAAAIETLFGERLGELSGLLAYHYAGAEEWDKAQEYLLKAGDQASNVAADAEALALYRRALVACQRVFGERWDPVQQAMLQRKIGEALFRQGKHEQAREYLERALARLDSPLPGSRWATRATIVREGSRQVWRSLLPSRVQLEPRPAEVTDEERMRIYRPLGWMDVWANRERFLVDALLGLRTSERGVHPVGEVEALSALGMVCDFAGAFWLAERFDRRALALAERLDNPIAVASVHASLGHHYHTMGRLQAALDQYEQAVAAFWRAGDVRGWGATADGRSLILCLQGKFEQSMKQSQETARVGEETGDKQVQGWGLHSLGEALLHVGPLEAAERQLRRARALQAEVLDHLGLAYTLGLLGQCYLRKGDIAGAMTFLQEGERHIALHSIKGANATSVYMGLAEANLLLVEGAEMAERPAALARAGEACEAALAQGRSYRMGLAAAYRWQGTFEWLRHRQGTARKRWHESVAVATEQGARCELGMTLLEMGMRLGDAAALQRAAEAFRAAGADADLSRALSA